MVGISAIKDYSLCEDNENRFADNQQTEDRNNHKDGPDPA